MDTIIAWVTAQTLYTQGPGYYAEKCVHALESTDTRLYHKWFTRGIIELEYGNCIHMVKGSKNF